MKKFFLFFCFALFPFVCTAQISSLKYNISSSFPDVIESKTRVLEHSSHNSFVFIDTLDTTYICHNPDLYLDPYTNLFYFYKKRLPLKIEISDMENVFHSAWYCGSINNEGVYGEIYWNSNYYITQRVHIFKLPEVNNLRKFTIATQMIDPQQRRLFAIGETYPSGKLQSYIMECETQGSQAFGTYNYAQMSDSEFVDDVALVEDNVVFATRDYRSRFSKVNLRISNVEQMLAGSEIDKQWRFQLEYYEHVYGRVFITHLNSTDIGVCYIKYNEKQDVYILCIHKININDLYSNITTFISQEIVIPKGEEILDIKFDDNKEVLIVLLDKDNIQSIFIHATPYNLLAPGFLCLESTDEERFFSLDTIQPHYLIPDRMYEAWGGNKCFIQRFTTDGEIQGSCFPYYKRYVNNALIKILKEPSPLDRLNGYRLFDFEELPWQQDIESRECFIISRED